MFFTYILGVIASYFCVLDSCEAEIKLQFPVKCVKWNSRCEVDNVFLKAVFVIQNL
jgi:hypothetical protein